MLRTRIFLYVPNFGLICILQAKNIVNKQSIPDYSLDPGLKLLESVSSEKNSWMGFSRRLSKSSDLHISVHFKPFVGQLQIERWHDLVRDEDNSSIMAVNKALAHRSSNECPAYFPPKTSQNRWGWVFQGSVEGSASRLPFGSLNEKNACISSQHMVVTGY